MDKKPDVSLREALCYISVAWNSLSPSTISNCWRHTGIIAKSPETEERHTTLETELEALLHSDAFHSADCVSAAEYLEVDRVVETGETFTDDEIVALVEGNEEVTVEESDDDCNETPHVAPTTRKAIEAASLLQSYFESRDDLSSILKTLDLQAKLADTLMKSKVQTTLDNFFSS